MTLNYDCSSRIVTFATGQNENQPDDTQPHNHMTSPSDKNELETVYSTSRQQIDILSNYLTQSTKEVNTNTDSLTFFQPVEFDDSTSVEEEIGQYNLRPVNKTIVKTELSTKGLTPSPSVCLGSTLSLPAKRTEEYQSGSKLSSQSLQQQQQEVKDNETYSTSGLEAKQIQKRNVVFDVLTRLSRSKLSEDRPSDDMRQYWMADRTCKECYECGQVFTTFRRRHHCRICGQIFCAKCCSEYAPGQMFGLNTNQRVCSYCHRVIRVYAQTTSGTADMNNFLMETSNLSQQKPKFLSYSVNDSNETYDIPFNPNFASNTPAKINLKTEPNIKVVNSQGSLDIDPSHIDVVDEEDQLPIAKDTLLAVWMKMQDLDSGLTLQTQRHRFKHYRNAITGAQVVDWLLSNKIAETQHYAENIGKALVDAKWLTPATNSTIPFKNDNRPYNLVYSTNVQDSKLPLEKDKADPLWLQAIDFNDEDDEMFDLHKNETGNIPHRDSISKRDANQPSESNFHLPTVSKFDTNNDTKRSSMATKLDEGVSFVDAYLGNSYIMSPSLPLRRASSLGQLNITQPSDFPRIDIEHFRDSVELRLTDSLPAVDKFDSSMYNSKRVGSDPCLLDKTMYLDSNSGTLNDRHTSMKGIFRKSFHEFDEGEAQKRLDQYTKTHLSSLMLQELYQGGLSSKWFDVLMPIITEISQTVRLNLQHDEVIDIRKFAKFKKVSGGAMADSEIIYGVVCSKNLTSKHTQKYYNKPKVLLLRCAFEFERKENKISSFDMLIMQEKEYISNLVNKVLALEPNLVIVERSVARIAQEMLINNGITLVTNMKSSVINRIARSTAGHQLVSLDQLSWEIQLGVCKKFFLKTFTISENETKTLMFFEGCPPVLGCSVCLRGGSRKELIKIKKIANFVLLSAYNLHLENAFIRDTFTKPLPIRTLPKYSLSSGYPTPPSSPRLKFAPAIQHTNGLCENALPLSGQSLCTEPSEELTQDLTTPFYKVFEKHIFTLSPHLVLNPPYLHTYNGTLSKVRKYLPNMLYWSNQFESIDASVVMGIDEANFSRETLCNSLTQLDNLSVFRGLSFISNRKPDIDRKKGKSGTYKKFDSNSNNYSTSVTSHKTYSVDSSSNLPAGFVKGITFKPTDYFSSSTSHWFVNAIILGTAPKNTFDGLLANYRATAQFSHLHQDQYPISLYLKYPDVKIEQYQLQDNSIESKLLLNDEKSTELDQKIDVLPTSEYLELDHDDYLEDFTYSTKRVDCFDMKYHQKIPVLFSSNSIESPNWPLACIKPWVIIMDFYGKRDIDLYNFLMKYCFRPNYNCLTDKCRVKMNKHLRYFAHGDAAIFLRTDVIKELSSEFERIRTWGQCITCKSSTPVSILSPEAQAFSFAKFLELKFYGKHLIRRLSSQQCTHAVFSDQIQFFSYGKWIAAFEYQKLNLKDVVLTSSLLTFDAKTLLLNQDWAKELKFLNSKMAETFNLLYTKLEILNKSLISEESTISEYKIKLAHEETDLMEKVKSLIAKADEFGCFSNDPQIHDNTQSFYKSTLEYLQDHLAYIKGVFSKAIRKWNNLYQGLVDSDSVSKQQKSIPGPSSRTYSDFTPSTTTKEFSVSNTIPEEIDNKYIDYDNFEVDSEQSNPDLSSLSSGRGSLIQHSDHYSLPSSPVKSSAAFMVFPKQNSLTAPSTSEVHGEVYAPSDFPTQEPPKRQMSEPPNFNTQKTKSLGRMGNKDFIEKKRPSIQKGFFTPVPLPFNTGDHFTLECGQIPLAIYESEPSSIIAYGLNSTSYKDKLSQLLRLEKTTKKNNISGTYSNDLAEEDRSVKSDINSDHEEHIELEFEDSGTHFYCKVFYAQQFMRLREEIYSEGEDCFIRSLSRCVDWAARGGKTRATFRKVLDNQFIIKQMSRTEVDSFITFANSYFAYIKSMIGNEKPTTLAKVLGVYRIGFRNTITNQSMKEDVLVIENLFYLHKCSKVFDLKGSLRNRYLQPNNKDSDVLLDENLLEYIGQTPIFLRPHAKSVLACAIENDSAFLSRHLIMDYSLLVGIDEESQQLLVGIIDYIRTFTWDKKLEMWVKSSGILGGGGKAPTVISPEKYKKRFCEAIDKYFPMVPDKWTVIGTEKIHLSS
ncbi:Pip5k3 protein [Oopsacas minuta]|uniref:1-phosphatidylinositol-3-phosphate 5-kinase n=1 Tax=Oopsacas minuta TaxID=111878 RepID=A0AAV7KF86_9METZ|nr:Pip5k3 protein [Oopsacas minuta]